LPLDIDLVVSLSHAVAKAVRPPPEVPHVCYCFTPMRYAWHLRDDYFGTGSQGHAGAAARLRGGAVPWLRNAVLDRIRPWDRKVSDRVTHFVAISQTVASRITECYGRTSHVIHPPVDTDFYTPAPIPRDDYYLCVSALVPYKRVDLAVEACRRLGRRLVVIGAGPELPRLRKLAGPEISLLGWRSNEEIRDHLRHCRALLFPGHEDFGIVPVEAMACSTPVVALRRGGATETLLPATAEAIGTGVFFDEPHPDCLAEAICWLESHPGQLSAALSRQQAMKFRAERFESELLGFLKKTLGN